MFSTRTFRRALLTSVLLLAVIPAAASAQASRTWVSGVGDDVNPCSRTAPCKTFAGAISKTAAGGEINAIDSGGFGAVTITKSITIDVRNVHGSILSPGSNGIIVNAAPTDRVVLRGIAINGAGSGINGVRILQARSVTLREVVIQGHGQNGILFHPTNPLSKLLVADSHIVNNGGSGIVVAPLSNVTARASVRRTTIEGNTCGVAAGIFGVGTTFGTDCGLATAAASPGRRASTILTDNHIQENESIGVLSWGSTAVQRLSRNEVTGNRPGLKVGDGGAIISYGNNLIDGNEVSDGEPTATVPLK